MAVKLLKLSFVSFESDEGKNGLKSDTFLYINLKYLIYSSIEFFIGAYRINTFVVLVAPMVFAQYSSSRTAFYEYPKIKFLVPNFIFNLVRVRD